MDKISSTAPSSAAISPTPWWLIPILSQLILIIIIGSAAWGDGDGIPWSAGGGGSASYTAAIDGGRRPTPPPSKGETPVQDVSTNIWRTQVSKARRLQNLAHLPQAYLLFSTSNFNDISQDIKTKLSPPHLALPRHLWKEQKPHDPHSNTLPFPIKQLQYLHALPCFPPPDRGKREQCNSHLKNYNSHNHPYFIPNTTSNPTSTMVKEIRADGPPEISTANARTLRSAAKTKQNKSAALLSVLQPKDPKAPAPTAKSSKKRSTENPRLDEDGWSFDDDDKEEEGLADATMDDATINEILQELNTNEESGGRTDGKKESPIELEEENENENSPSSSPLKKKSKKAVLDSLITPKTGKKPDAAKTPKPKSATNSVTANPSTTPSNKRTATVMKADGSVVKSALKSNSKATKVTPPEKTTVAAPVHKHKGIVIEASIDFRKPAFAAFDNDPCKKTSHGLKQLLINLHIGDQSACILMFGDPEGIHIGPGGVKVPDNMTALSNYCKGFNPKVFQTTSNGGGGDRLDSLGEGIGSGNGKGGKNNKSTAYFLFLLGCNKDPVELITQVSFEWGKFGSHIRVKELQALDTETIYCFFFLFSQTSRALLMEELKCIFKEIQDDMLKTDFHLNDSDCEVSWVMKDIPSFNLRSNVPKLPRANTHAMTKLPGHLQTHRRQFHLECASEDKGFFKCLLEYGKKSRFIKDWWGQHVHPSEVVDYDSAPGDCHRFEKISKRSLNFNASLTSLEVHGFLNLCDKIDVFKGDVYIASLTGRDVLTTIFKLENGSPLIVEVHQLMGGAPALFVFPNIPEAEALVTSFGKHAAGFALGYMLNEGMDKTFIWQFLEKFCDPALVHQADDCVFDTKTRTILTPDELAEESGAGALEEQSWYLDILKLEEEKGKPKRGYANEKVMFNFGAEQSVKTMHEKNDVNHMGANDSTVGSGDGEDGDGASLSTVQKAGLKKKHLEEEKGLDSREVETIGDDEEEKFVYDEEGLQAESETEVFPEDKQSGHTPKSGKDRLSDEDVDMASTGSSESGDEETNLLEKAPASEAGSQTPSNEAGGSG
jgi:hypothetical protein